MTVDEIMAVYIEMLITSKARRRDSGGKDIRRGLIGET